MLIPVSLATESILAATVTSFLAPTLRVDSGVRSRVKCFSDLADEFAERGRGLGQLLSFKRFEVLGRRFGRTLQASAVLCRRGKHSAGGQVEQVKHELIGMLRLDSKLAGARCMNRFRNSAG
jgi:hypothetical protein